jgi:hypothetical protein
MLAQRLDMQRDRFGDELLDLVAGTASRHAARKVGYVRPPRPPLSARSRRRTQSRFCLSGRPPGRQIDPKRTLRQLITQLAGHRRRSRPVRIAKLAMRADLRAMNSAGVRPACHRTERSVPIASSRCIGTMTVRPALRSST